MPEDAPGSLSEKEVLDIIAYVIQTNGFPAGDKEIESAKRAGDDQVRAARSKGESEGGAEMATVTRVVTLVVSLACIAHVGRRPDGHVDDRRDQRHRHRQHQVGAARRDRHALRPVADGHQRRRHRSERPLPFFDACRSATTS